MYVCIYIGNFQICACRIIRLVYPVALKGKLMREHMTNMKPIEPLIINQKFNARVIMKFIK